jgi:UDP:flavonoid glycosyltransferase YjiC (YdhE family)
LQEFPSVDVASYVGGITSLRLVIHVNGEPGHLRPAIPIALAWRARGHEVIVAADSVGRAETEGFGLDLSELSLPSFDPSVMRSIEQTPAPERPRAALSLFFNRAVGCATELTQIVQTKRADVILRDNTGWAAVFSGERAGVSVACLFVLPARLRSLRT